MINAFWQIQGGRYPCCQTQPTLQQCPHTHLEYGIASTFITPGSWIAWAWLTSQDMFWGGVLFFSPLSCQLHMLVALQTPFSQISLPARLSLFPHSAPALRVLPEPGEVGATQTRLEPPGEPGGVPPTWGISLSTAGNGFFSSRKGFL